LIPKFWSLPIAELTASMVKEWLTELPCSNKRKKQHFHTSTPALSGNVPG
jgi:hypothetical protein